MISSPLLLEPSSQRTRSLSISPSVSLLNPGNLLLSPQTTAQSGHSSVSSGAPSTASAITTTITDDFDITPYCIGTPHTIGTSSSGTIQLQVSLQEEVIYLPCPEANGPSSYREHDNGITADPFSSNTPPVNDPLNENYSPSSSFTNTPDMTSNVVAAATAAAAAAAAAAATSSNTPSLNPVNTASSHNSHNPSDHHHHNNNNNNNDHSARSRSSHRTWLGRRHHESPSSSPSSRTSSTDSNTRSQSPPQSTATTTTTTTAAAGTTQQQQHHTHPSRHVTNLINSALPPDSGPGDMQPAILRGSLVMKLSKPTKIKDISLRFYGKSKSNWLESNYSKDLGVTLPHGPEFQDEVLVNSHTWDFVPNNADATAHPSSIVNLDGVSVVTSDLLGADVAYIRPGASSSSSSGNLSPGLNFKTPLPTPEPSNRRRTSVSSMDILSDNDGDYDDDGDDEDIYSAPHHNHHNHHHHNHHHHHQHHNQRRSSEPQLLSLNHVPFFTPLYFNPPNSGKQSDNQALLSPSFNPVHGTSATTYPAGQYVFHFTLAIDPRTAETIRCPNGTIRYYLVARINRASRFSFATTGHREVTLVRSPPDSFDSTVDSPIAISRDWDNRLHYEIMCPKKYIPLGTSIPLSIKLTPIDKVQVHRVRVQVIEVVNYICAKSDLLQHVEPIRKVTLFQQRAPSTEPKEPKPLQPVTSTSSSLDKNKKKSNLTPGNLLNYLKSPTASTSTKHAPSSTNTNNQSNSLINTTSDLNSDLGELLSATTEISCTLPFVSREDNWDSVASHHFISPPPDSKYFQFLRPDAIHNPFIHVRHRLHVSFRLSKKDSQDSKRRYFEVLIDTPIHFLSKYCKSESIDLPLYEEGNQMTQQQQFQYHQQLLLQYQNELQQYSHGTDASSSAINIPRAYASGEIGSPLVRVVSSDTSHSPTYEGFSQFDTPPTLPPSFDDALADPLLSAPGSPLPPNRQQPLTITGSPLSSSPSSDTGTIRSVPPLSNESRASLASSVVPTEPRAITPPGATAAPTQTLSAAAAAAAAPPPNYADIMRETVPLLRENSNSSGLSGGSSAMSSFNLAGPPSPNVIAPICDSPAPSILSTVSAGVGIGIRAPVPNAAVSATPLYVHNNLSTNGSRLQVHSNYFGRNGLLSTRGEDYTESVQDSDDAERQLFMESMQSSRFNTPGF
ncbi:uncharacterized protein SAPINGB_P000473 [Magnusiomyces paraingens]|uniref:Arrestin C-terminal-like domain-containing protein n=1 Tax=Magnusiomyces paraingens TaxID=2606893 RepID=A0A5E8B0P8_9ASCO|nr:uncharacterized protein SAPINGB_P000473 [Saprochaete ingens]VVT44609.1 unnamed protein product [Saprochaete ingens]